MMKKLILPALLVTSLIFSCQTSARAIFTIDVKVNNVLIDNGTGGYDAGPYIEQETNTSYVPIRFVSENLGATVSWNKQAKKVTIKSEDGKVIELTVGSKTAYVNGEKMTLPNAPVMPSYPNRVMVPLRYISEVLGATVNVKKVDGILHVDITTS
ncbi:copper amine oxidase N-terminal domain-containing protein [Paenibacillus sp. 7124]|uniref:Copper amine oxidase N-terminal domain-containing protein n=1 Tax=Paenibacillus apii TaxID=1850370 RepID=A0A6M1PV40_9BACL|nr:copper amine oxidase N-terminal domain-containing protein [Paenibacillus apii]NGM84101.1 copper amine oxidase N-terminal domain-containing protein [Paenibacillus apii]NJJ38719.1 copper amine oxidase N-terminal domain-containing protein [Paenibacillus apii]